jgi:hypothetical protein
LIQQLKRKLEFLKEQTKKETDKNENKQQRFRLEVQATPDPAGLSKREIEKTIAT